MKSASVYDSENYSRIEMAIAFMRHHHLSQPDLATVAQHIGLSEYHFQRLFTQWAGISPKRFGSSVLSMLNYLNLVLKALHSNALRIISTKSML